MKFERRIIYLSGGVYWTKGSLKGNRIESEESNQGDISDQMKKGAHKFHRYANN